LRREPAHHLRSRDQRPEPMPCREEVFGLFRC
jgi:hypothetical protein